MDNNMRQLLEKGCITEAMLLFYRQVFHVLTVLTLVILWAAYFLILPQTWGIWAKLLVSVAAASTASPLFRAYLGAVAAVQKNVSGEEEADVPAILSGIIERVRAERVPGLIAALTFLAAVLLATV